MRKIFKRFREDRADSELISLIFVIPIVLGILFTTIDASIYFQNRSVVQSVTRDAARTVAIWGGSGTRSHATPLENGYGQGRSALCNSAIPFREANGSNGTRYLNSHPVTMNAYNNNTTKNIECTVLKTLAESKSLTSVKITAINCSPSYTANVGEVVSCYLWWEYGSIPGSAMGFIPLAKNNVTNGSANSEVRFGSGDLVPRPYWDN